MEEEEEEEEIGAPTCRPVVDLLYTLDLPSATTEAIALRQQHGHERPHQTVVGQVTRRGLRPLSGRLKVLCNTDMLLH